MASATKGWARRTGEAPQRRRVLTAAANRLAVDNRAEVRRQRAVRQNWQLDAFVYRNSIGELRYAVNFLANCAARMRIFVAVLPPGGESGMPVDVRDLEGVPAGVLAACANAINDLGNGRMSMSQHLHSVSTNISLAGEGYLLGQEDPMTGSVTWSIRSVSEIVVYNDEVMLREGPIDSTGMLGLVPLAPSLTTISRMWQPDPQFRLLADSPMRAILNECEALLILRRMIRATGRSRLAGRGLLLFPDELSISVDNDDNSDADGDPVMNSLLEAMMTPISNEGDASAVVPTIVRGPSEYLKEIRLVELGATFDELAGKTREELIGVIATGLDLPKEIIMGVADLNHWTAWQVDDNTFRHHVEPHVITITDCLTGAFLRPYIEGCGLDPATVEEWMPRVMFWYDPTELVTHPDRTNNATIAHAALSISDSSFRGALGFEDTDAPSAEEIELRMIRSTRTYPPNLLMGLMHLLDPTLTVPPIATSGTIPGIEPGGVSMPPPAPVALPAGPAAPDATAGPVVTPAPIGGAAPGPMDIPGAPAAGLTSESIAAMSPIERRAALDALRANFIAQTGIDPYELTASSKPKVAKASAKSKRLSRKLTAIDIDLRARLQTAASAALARQLEKAGSRMRQKVAKNPLQREKIHQTRNEFVMATLGKQVVESSGLTAAALMGNEWETLRSQYYAWVPAAHEQALSVAAQLTGLEIADLRKSGAAKFQKSVDEGWRLLAEAMDTLAIHAAYDPNPNHDSIQAAGITATDAAITVPTGVVRAALGVAGGNGPQDYGLVGTRSGAMVPAIPLGNVVGGVASGGTIGAILSDAGCTTDSYEWVHGPSDKPFLPHEDLDGVEFANFDDDALANTGDFPENQFFFPGDHSGCLCDFTPNYVSAQDVADATGGSSVDLSVPDTSDPSLSAPAVPDVSVTTPDSGAMATLTTPAGAAITPPDLTLTVNGKTMTTVQQMVDNGMTSTTMADAAYQSLWKDFTDNPDKWITGPEDFGSHDENVVDWLLDSSAADHKAMTSLIREQGVTSTQPLFRGMHLSDTPEAILAKYQVGAPMDLGPTSFSIDPQMASTFAGLHDGQTRVMVLMDPGVSVVDLTGAAMQEELPPEGERVTAGLFKVLGVRWHEATAYIKIGPR